MDITSNFTQNIDSKFNEYFKDLESGQAIGYTFGFDSIDRMVGRLKEGNIAIVGGYSGTGKSFFVLNMIDGMMNEYGLSSDVKVGVFSTELSAFDYTLRHAYMRFGRYMLGVERDRDPQEIERFISFVKDDFLQERMLNPYMPLVVGDVDSYEKIEKETIEGRFDVVIVDHLQDLSYRDPVTKRLYIREEDTMPILPKLFKDLATKTNTAFILISQLNNKAMSEDVKVSKVSPYAYGKQLFQKADIGLMLQREKLASKLSPILEVDVTKSRNAEYGTCGFKILSGFKLHELTSEQLVMEKSIFQTTADEY